MQQDKEVKLTFELKPRTPPVPWYWIVAAMLGLVTLQAGLGALAYWIGTSLP